MVSPIEYREEIMRTAHASVTGGHMGVKKTQMKVAKRLGWVDEKCDVCAKYHRGTVKKLQNMCVGAPWERVAIDVTGPHRSQAMVTSLWSPC